MMESIRPTAGGIILGPENKIAITNQRKNSWSIPKGGVDPGEEILEAAKREIREETGITELELIEKLGVYSRYRIPLDGDPEDTSVLKEITVYLFRTDQEELSPEDPHNPEAVWLDVDEVPERLTHQKDKDFFESVIPRIQEEIAKL